MAGSSTCYGSTESTPIASIPLPTLQDLLAFFFPSPKLIFRYAETFVMNRSTEDYIKSIYILAEKGKAVTTTELAKHLKIGNGSVTGMLKKLSAKKLIDYEPYRGVSLTEPGRRLALRMVRRHRLWEMFLARFLGYRWDEIHDEAERLEHVTSDELERRLDQALGNPKIDPHGHPIPDARGKVVEHDSRALTDCTTGDSVRIVSVNDTNADLLHHATEIGLTLDAKVTVKKKMAFDGSMVLKIGTKERFVSSKLAESVFVREV